MACVILGAVYLVLVKPYKKKYGAIRSTTYTFLLGFFALYLIVGLRWGNWIDPLSLFRRPIIEVSSIITPWVWNTCIAFVLWLCGLANVPDIGRRNYLFLLKPIIALGLAYFILDNLISVNQIIAIIVITVFVIIEIFFNPISFHPRKL